MACKLGQGSVERCLLVTVRLHERGFGLRGNGSLARCARVEGRGAVALSSRPLGCLHSNCLSLLCQHLHPLNLTSGDNTFDRGRLGRLNPPLDLAHEHLDRENESANDRVVVVHLAEDAESSVPLKLGEELVANETAVLG